MQASSVEAANPDHPRACGANEHRVHVAVSEDGSSPRVRGKRPSHVRKGFRKRIIPARAGQTRCLVSERQVSPDHPRACGANLYMKMWARGSDGSSPRVRGKLVRVLGRVALGRIIPARAGQTVALLSAANAPPDHPRACGANHSDPRSPRVHSGSSPRVRGKHVSCFTMRDCLRIIPARAGQTYVVMNTTGVDPDHPRACGANADNGQTVATRNGSSPRVRGKLARSAQVGHGVRIIPARAGQTHARHAPARTSPDHPRACGANVRGARYAVLRDGSSPRVRGKPGGDPPVGHQLRIIPARAGQTPACSHCRRTFPDHPRACGANSNSVSEYGKGGRIIPARAGQTLRPDDVAGPDADHPRACGANLPCEQSHEVTAGSSPRVRGKRRASAPSLYSRRIIPARAGQTGLMARHPLHRPDHPRACGANEPILPPCHVQIGSSPRVRGKLLQHVPAHAVRRIIPARAGQTCRYIIVFLTVSDHPRACGANCAVLAAVAVAAGSSPRVRGKL